jgi:uncharacterized protein YegL
MDSNTIEKNIPVSVTDVIVVLDMSGSMSSMGKEPVQSVNAFIAEQKLDADDDGSTFTLITFSSNSKIVVDHVPIMDAKAIDEDSYNPAGGTALNDAVCFTIKSALNGERPKNKIMVIITDGDENSSQDYTTDDTRTMVSDCQDNHDWQFIFIGANIDAFASGHNISIERSQCGQFTQDLPGDLLQMCRQTSSNIKEFKRARSEGLEIPELIAAPSLVHGVSCPVDNKTKNKEFNRIMSPLLLRLINANPVRSELQSPISDFGLLHDPIILTDDLLLAPPSFARQTTGVGI